MDQPVEREHKARGLARVFGPGGPRWRLLAALSGFLVLLVGGLLLSIVLGARDGMALREAQQATAAAEHYERGVRYLQEQQYELAEAELAHVLSLNPGHSDALTAWREVENALAAEVETPTPAPTATPVVIAQATPPASSLTALEALFVEAESLQEEARWEEAALRLEQLRTLAPDYEPDRVAAMLQEVYYQHAQELAGAGHFERALRSFDQALELRPDDQEVQHEREMLALYTETLGAWGADWDITVGSLMALLERDPDYRDVEQRLLEAHRQHGDILARRAEWCAAAEEYAQALEVRDDEELARLRDDADYLCRTATPTPTSVPTPEPGSASTPSADSPSLPVVPTGFGSRDLAFSVVSEDGGQPEIWLVPSDGGGPKRLFQLASQPAFSPDGTAVAFRSNRSDMLGLAIAPVEGGAWQRVTDHVEDSQPAWSADGEQLIFASNREGDRRWRIYRSWAGGGSPATMVAYGQAPAWAPDGTRVAYQGCNQEGARCGLWVLNLEDGVSAPLTDVPGDTAPVWSSDGRHLLFASQERVGNWEIYELELATGEPSAPFPHPGNDVAPAWSADGQWLAFLSDRSGVWGVYVAAMNEEAPIEPSLLLELEGDPGDPSQARLSWSR